MARVLIPQNSRIYNQNPRGSSTATVLMKGNNPFERPIRMTNARLAGGAIPGMSGLGDDSTGYDTGEGNINASGQAVTAPGPNSAAAPGIDWTKLLTGVATAGAQVGTAALNQRINTIGGNTKLPVVNANAKPASSSVMPWAIGGGALVVGLGLLFLMIRK